MDDATRAELDAIRKRVEAATPGPWEAGSGNGVHKGISAIATTHGDNRHANAQFIGGSITDIPRLLAIIDEQEREIARLNAHVKDLNHDVQAAVDEANWQHRQGDEYGSY